MKTIEERANDGICTSLKKIPYNIFDNDNEYLCRQDRWNAYNIREEFHAANAHDIIEYLMSL